MEEIILKSISTIGIPAAIAFYLLVKFSRSIDRLSDSIDNLVKKNSEQYNDLTNRFEQKFLHLEDQILQVRLIHESFHQSGTRPEWDPRSGRSQPVIKDA